MTDREAAGDALRQRLLEHDRAYREDRKFQWIGEARELLREAAACLSPQPSIGELLQSIAARTSERDQARAAIQVLDASPAQFSTQEAS